MSMIGAAVRICKNDDRYSAAETWPGFFLSAERFGPFCHCAASVQTHERHNRRGAARLNLSKLAMRSHVDEFDAATAEPPKETP
jgi:hypothetical protein